MVSRSDAVVTALNKRSRVGKVKLEYVMSVDPTRVEECLAERAYKRGRVDFGKSGLKETEVLSRVRAVRKEEFRRAEYNQYHKHVKWAV